MTLGHFPQSFEYATIGGFAATRSAGQASSGYGRFDELVTSIALTAPAGELRTLETPHSAAGPALRELVDRLRGRAGADHRGDRAGPSGAGAAPLRGVDGRRLRLRRRDRALARAGRRAPGRACASPTRRRRGSRWRSRGTAGAKRALLSSYLRLRGRAGGCLIVCGWEGERRSGRAPPRARRRRLLRSGGAARSGRRARPCLGARALRGPLPARRAARPRLPGRDPRDGPHLEPPGRALRRGPRRDRRRAGDARERPGVVMCHLSHAYRDGASLYFTFLARSPTRRRARAVARRQGGGLRGDRRDGGHDHPSPRGGPRPPPLHARRDRGAGDRGPASGQGAPRPGRDHEPGQADPRSALRCRASRASP